MTADQSFSTIENLEEILLARLLRDQSGLYEASLARVWQHVRNAPEFGFAILTSWRQSIDGVPLSSQENHGRLQKLKGSLRDLGLGFFVVNGHWKECQETDVSWEDCPPDKMVDAVEPALFVSNISLEQAHKLGNDYQQDAILYSGPETKGNTILVDRAGKTIELGAFSPNTISQGFSQLRGSKKRNRRTFKFEGLSWKIQGRTEALIEQAFRDRSLRRALSS